MGLRGYGRRTRGRLRGPACRCAKWRSDMNLLNLMVVGHGALSGAQKRKPDVIHAITTEAFIDAGVPIRDVQNSTGHADSRLVSYYDRRASPALTATPRGPCRHGWPANDSSPPRRDLPGVRGRGPAHRVRVLPRTSPRRAHAPGLRARSCFASTPEGAMSERPTSGVPVGEDAPSIIGREQFVVEGIAKVLHDAAKYRYDYTGLKQERRGTSFMLHTIVDETDFDVVVSVTLLPRKATSLGGDD